jgi:hypothetical protein
MASKAANDNRRDRAIDRAFAALVEVARALDMDIPDASNNRDTSQRYAEQAEAVQTLVEAIRDKLTTLGNYNVAMDWSVGADYPAIQDVDNGDPDDRPTE